MIKKTPPGTGLVLGREEATIYGRRGGLRQVVRHMVCVEDEMVSTADIAQRGRIGVSTAQTRLKLAQAADGPVTWASLGVKP